MIGLDPKFALEIILTPLFNLFGEGRHIGVWWAFDEGEDVRGLDSQPFLESRHVIQVGKEQHPVITVLHLGETNIGTFRLDPIAYFSLGP